MSDTDTARCEECSTELVSEPVSSPEVVPAMYCPVCRLEGTVASLRRALDTLRRRQPPAEVER